MEELKFNVYKNCLTIEDPFKPHIHPAADTVKYLKGTFTFDSTWDGFEKRIYFKNASYNIVKSVLLGDSNICYVPWEVLAHTGVIRCNIIGLKYSDDIVTQRITTNPVVFEIIVDESILEPYDQQPLTPTEYEQFRILFNSVYESTIEAKDETIDAKDDVLEAISTLDIPLEQAQEYAETSEAYAVGTRSGNPVESDDPTYENNARYYSQQSLEYMTDASTAKADAEDARDDANASKLEAAGFSNTSMLFAYDSEAYAVGKRNEQDVDSSDITYQNNAKYYKDQALAAKNDAYASAGTAMTAKNDTLTALDTVIALSQSASRKALVSEGFAVGEQEEVPVSSDSPYYENNAKYYAEYAEHYAEIVRRMTISTTPPTSSEGEEGDIWYVCYPVFTLINGTDVYEYQYDPSMSWASFINSYFNQGQNSFITDTGTNEVLWETTNTRIYYDENNPVYVLKADMINNHDTYYVEAVPISEPEEPGSGE